MTTRTATRRAARRLRRNHNHARPATAAARPAPSLGEVRIELTVEEILADLVYPSPPPDSASEEASSTSRRVP